MTPARRPSAGRPALGPAKRRRYTVHLTPTMANEIEQQAAIAGIAPGRLLARIVEAQLVGAKRATANDEATAPRATSILTIT